MLTEICRHIKNFFLQQSYEGEFEIKSGVISPSDFLLPGDCYLIEGSQKNDGVHVNPSARLSDECFEGRITKMNPPTEFLDICKEIERYVSEQKQDSAQYLKESFGGYSYTRFSSKDGTAIPWQSAFRSRLNAWRKM